MGLVFDDVVGIVEIINSKDVKVQVCAASQCNNKLLFSETRTDSGSSVAQQTAV